MRESTGLPHLHLVRDTTTTTGPVPDVDALRALLRQGERVTLESLVDAGLDRLPFPGGGRTLSRWAWLSEVAAHDLSLAKLYEGHTDALAILAELGADLPPAGSRWGTWCAEPPTARVLLLRGGDTKTVTLQGTKAWCSGAASVSHALVSCWNDAGEPCLAAVVMDQPGVRVTGEGWSAVGMAGSASVDVVFDAAVAQVVGRPGDYTARPGFWQGGAGIAACWLGGALGIARRTRSFMGASGDPYKTAHLGAIDTALVPVLALLREAAAAIDAQPRADAQPLALQTRLAAEAACETVMRHAGRALGAAPLCRDADFARAMADLPVYLRQSHAERDLASLGQLAAQRDGWAL